MNNHTLALALVLILMLISSGCVDQRNDMQVPQEAAAPAISVENATVPVEQSPVQPAPVPQQHNLALAYSMHRATGLPLGTTMLMF